MCFVRETNSLLLVSVRPLFPLYPLPLFLRFGERVRRICPEGLGWLIRRKGGGGGRWREDTDEVYREMKRR